ncbi:alpha-2-macroglobulin [Uliginosibacterium sp. sgz301328]|uniref:alpha-2-macroglobulin family protein n=1 Tax=Uliginosibacterium sp. sgz301328 TaxID=3243764 RepID=UPI00359D2828
MSPSRILSVAAIVGLAFIIPPTVAVDAARVESFSPKGEVKAVRQVVARFSEPMVTFGDPRTEAPFDINCPAKGNGHWADTRNWIYDFEQDLPAGLNCQFKLRDKITTHAGGPVTPATFAFSTGGPAVRNTWPHEGSEEIDEQQVFLLGLDAPADVRSIKGNAYCSVSGIGERIGLEVIEGAERDKIIAEQQDRAHYFFGVLTKRGQLGTLAVKDNSLKDAPLVLARCARRLPPGAEVSLVWGAGIRTASGIPTRENQTLTYRVREDFVIRQSCMRLNAEAGCTPVLPLTLSFSAPVPRELAAKITLKGASGTQSPDPIGEHEKTVDSVSFAPPFAPRSEVTLSLPSKFVDDSGRSPTNAASFPLKVRIDDDPPLIKFPSRFGILESNAQPMLPVTVRNVEATLKGLQLTVPKDADRPASGRMARIDARDDTTLARWIARVMRGPEDSDDGYVPEGTRSIFDGDEGAKPLTLPRTDGDRTFEVIGIPLPKPGFYVVEFASDRLGAALHGEKAPYYAYSSALVTNMAVHFKHGRESSLVWVTQLDNAQPVAGAKVRISDCRGEREWEGVTDDKGMARVEREIPRYSRWKECRYAPSAHIVTARKGDDTSFMLSTWQDGIERWQFNLTGGDEAGPVLAHTVTDRPLFRAGETVSMKHFVRTHVSAGFGELKGANLPSKLVIEHMGSGQTYEQPLSWSNGSALSTWVIPKEAKLGGYDIYLRTPNGRTLHSGTFRVEQFRVPLMRAQLKPPATPAVGGGKVEIDAQLSYMAGGPAAGQSVKFRSRLEPHTFSFSQFDDFSFGGSAPREGITAVQPYAYDPYGDDEEDVDDEAANASSAGQSRYPVQTRTVTLDSSGGARVAFDGLPKVDAPQALAVEMEYSDPNGQILTAATRALVLPSQLVLGMRMESYYATKDKLAFKVLAVDAAGKPQAGRKVVVDAYSRSTYAYRKRLLGGFYSYEQTQEVRKAGVACKGETDAKGLVVCDGEAPATGELILVARADDAAGNTAVASRSIYVAGADDWFNAGSSDRIDILADKRSYEPGDKARFEVRMPFREATALVTVEREGVLASYVQQISAKSPFVDVPIADNYGPNAYVSVMVVRGRVDPEQPGPFAWLRRMVYRIGMFFGIVKEMPREVDTRPTALVDLTKPAFKLGMVPIRVGWKAYELKVAVQPEHSTYKVRDKAAVHITVTDADGKPASGAEVALAAVDEGLLALAPADSWNLLDAMMKRRPDEVDTSTAQSQVIGKRHFGKKAVAAGGGGGSANARELFDTLLLWQGSIKLDANGSARVEVPLNDSLTSFRIEAIAHAGIQQFGSGGASINTTQELMLFAGLPPFVREGDRFAAMVTVRNGGERALKLDVTAQYAAAGSQDGRTQAAPPAPLPPQSVSLQAGEAKTLSFAAIAPVNATRLDWSVTAQETGGAAHDALKVSQTVGAAYPVRVYQQTLEQLEAGKPLTFPVQIPKGAVAGRGGVDVRLAKSLGGDFSAVRDWMSRYPYVCLEQQTSVAIALEDEKRWTPIANRLPVYLDGDGLARYFPTPLLQGDDTLTAYLLAITNEAGWEIPEASRDRMLKGLSDFVAGRVIRHGALPTADLAMRKLAAIEALSRYDAAKASMLQSIEIAPNLWPSSAVLDWISVLSRMKDIPDREAKLNDARQILRSRLMFSGTTLNFSTEKADYLWWLMVTPDLNAVRALRLLSDDPSFAADMPRLARGALGRQQAGHWRTTNANAWGVLALRRFQQRFERDPVTGLTEARLGDMAQTLNWSQAQSRNTGDPTQGTPIGDGVDAHFGWPAGTAQLSLAHEGGGKPWAFIASRAALPLDKALFAGYQIKRTVTPIEQKKSGVWSRGDVYRVTLDVDAQSDMTWVVINDPIPAGATILGSGLGGDSSQLASGEKAQGWVRPTFEERAFEGFRAYYRYMPKGKVQLQYTVRLNNVGAFEMPGSRVEALYAPEVFGEMPVPRIEVKEP